MIMMMMMMMIIVMIMIAIKTDDDDDDSTKGFRLKEYNDKMSSFVAQEHDWNERKRYIYDNNVT